LNGKERLQRNAGQLDLLLQDPESLKRYEVEIQLSATDESHIIRSIEYWDIERKRYPQYEHAVAEPTDRTFWETRGSKKTLAVMDQLLGIIREVEPKAVLKYNKHYIGIEVNGAPLNFVTYMPRKAHIIMTLKLPKTIETDEQLSEGGFETLAYDAQWRQYRLRVEVMPEGKQREILTTLAKQAREGFGK